MHVSTRVCPAACLGLAVLAGPFLAHGAAPQKPVKGKVQRNVYLSPANNFSIPVPQGFKISDAHFDSYGAVSFHDDFGNLQGILYAAAPPDTLARIQQGGNTNELLFDWLGNIAMPAWFKPASPESRVLAEASGTFKEMPAVYALIDAPGANALEKVTVQNGKMERKREDSRRVAVIFHKGRYIYMLVLETVTFSFFESTTPAEPGGDWMGRADKLKPFYQSISFRP